MTDANTDDTLYLVDGSGFIFRAYFALPQNLTNPAGLPVGAVLGFCNMLAKLIGDLGARRIAVVFDTKGGNFRHEIYPDYKANRDEPPADLVPQFPLFRQAAAAFGLPVVEAQGFEADDLIAAYAAREEARGGAVTIVGSDKDLYQLVSPRVQLLDPIRQAVIGPEAVEAKFGVGPERVVDVQALAGDATDNIPGVPGIGVKTAAALVAEYGDLEAILASAGEVKQPKRRQSLLDNAELARVSLRLVTLDRGAPTPVELAALEAPDLGRPDLRAFLEEHGFTSLLKRLSLAPQKRGEAAPAPAAPEADYTLITTMEGLEAAIAGARETGVLAVDTETTGLTPAKADLVGIALSWAPGRAAYIPLAHTTPGGGDLLGGLENPPPGTGGGTGGGRPAPEQLPAEEVMGALAPILADPSVLKIAHNAKYDWQMLAKHGVEMAPTADTMLMAYALGEHRRHGLGALAAEMLGVTMTPYEAVAGKGKSAAPFSQVDLNAARDYAAEDADMAGRLHAALAPRIVRARVARVYEDIDRPLVPVVARMEAAGIAVDRAALARLSSEFGGEMAGLEARIHDLAGGPFNVASPQQVAQVLFERLALPGGAKTKKTGAWSTAAGTLDKLAEDGHEIAERLLEWRALAKLKSTYADALPKQIAPATGRVHTSFSLAHTATGRLASSDPNLQNIPVRTERGRRVRACFVAPEGARLVAIDYSQIELRVAAALADCAALRAAFAGGQDIHAATAAQVFGEATPETRRAAKAINFGILYGISAFGLARQLGCARAEAAELIRAHGAKFPEIGAYMAARANEAAEKGYVETLFGRRCPIAGAGDRNPVRRAGAARQAGNAPLQGTAADIMKIAMADMDRALARSGLAARMLLQVHDEMVFEAPEGEVEALAALATEVMEGAADIGVPLVAEWNAGTAWGVWDNA